MWGLSGSRMSTKHYWPLRSTVNFGLSYPLRNDFVQDLIGYVNQALEGLSTHCNVPEVAESLPSALQEEVTTDRDSQNPLPLDDHISACAQTPQKSSAGRVRDIRDAVTPLWRTAYDEQLVLKKRTLAQVLKRFVCILFLGPP